jgi:hypothetical protein
MKGGLIGVVVVLLVAWFVVDLTPVDPIPNGVTCGSTLVEVTAKTPRANGMLVERHALGCTFYYFESRGDSGDSTD